MLRKPGRSVFLLGVLAASLIIAGCGKKPAPQPEELAERGVERFLDAWSRGESVDKFADPDGSIQGDDPDWKTGNRLLSFLSSNAKRKPDDPDCILCRVSLNVQDKKGRKQEKEVVYEVRLGEKTVIKRASP